jgi:hypothetical protein
MAQQWRFINPAQLTERFSIARLRPLEQRLRVGEFGFHECWRQSEHVNILRQNSRERARPRAQQGTPAQVA